ncbi:Tarsl2 protein [Zopfochytrium polystomum]|nr:Tarsl2 protein [Zopfochytrium polystomum]
MLTITLADGKTVQVRKGEATPRTVLRPSRKSEPVVARLHLGNGTTVPWDMDKPLLESCAISIVPVSAVGELNSESPETTVGRDAIWHSAAHLLGWAMEQQFRDTLFLTDGPALKTAPGTGGIGGGYFYDALLSRNGPDVIRSRLDRLGPVSDAFGDISAKLPLLRMDPSSDLRRLLEVDATFNVNDDQMTELARAMRALSDTRAPFQRMQVSRDFARLLFYYSPFKLNLLSRIPDSEPVTIYRCGNFVDLCRGPHVPHVGLLRETKLLRTGAAQWNLQFAGSDEANSSVSSQHLSRITGITFPTPAQLQSWERLQAEAAARDHRVIGRQQSLFWMHPFSPGSAFLLPHGTRIANRLRDFIRAEYRRGGYQEVETPLLFNKQLWETSGHWENYRDDMFVVGDHDSLAKKGKESPSSETPTSEDHHSHSHEELEETHGLKPMNCPGHCLIFKNKRWSYRELPVRLAEFSPLHRNEASGALTGLTRVRKFHQDDAHIFCRPDQIQSEISATLAFIDRVYRALQFPDYTLALSTRPLDGKSMGTDAQWSRAEAALRGALEATGRHFDVKEGDGAFYGPKIDVMVRDAVGRSHQTATVQLDFQLPIRFKLQYDDGGGGGGGGSASGEVDAAADSASAGSAEPSRPVMIHRAALGSVERMLGILIEHYAGRWPFWLSPRQAVVIPATSAERVVRYARWVGKALESAGSAGAAGAWDAEAVKAMVERGEEPDGAGAVADLAPAHPGARFHYVDVRLHDVDASLGKRVRDAWVAKYNYVVVVGEREVDAGNVAVRWTMSGEGGKKDKTETMTVPQLLQVWQDLEKTFQ